MSSRRSSRSSGAVLVPLTSEAVVTDDVATSIARPDWWIDLHDRVDIRPRMAANGARSSNGSSLDADPAWCSSRPDRRAAPVADAATTSKSSSKKFRRPVEAAISWRSLPDARSLRRHQHALRHLECRWNGCHRGGLTCATICRAIETHRVEVLPTTPSFLNLLMRSDALDRYDLGSLRKINFGTEVMPQQTLDRVRGAFPGVDLQQTYGLSEVGVLRSQSLPGSLWMRVGGDGSRPRSLMEFSRSAPQYAMVGYLNAPDPFDAEGWFDTQDLVEVDGEWLRIIGRDTVIINVAGQKVYPADVEQAILDLPKHADVAVVGEPHRSSDRWSSHTSRRWDLRIPSIEAAHPCLVCWRPCPVQIAHQGRGQHTGRPLLGPLQEAAGEECLILFLTSAFPDDSSVASPDRARALSSVDGPQLAE